MADKFLNLTAVQTIKTWAKGLFATQTALQTLSDEVDEIIAEGGEPNIIEIVKVNGSPLTPDANKAVDVTVPTATSDLTNDGDGSSNFATEDYVALNGGKIDVIKVNGTAQTITNKEVNIQVPTAVSDLTNDSGFQTSNDVDGAISDALSNSGDAYQTASDVDSKISTALTSAMVYKGSVNTYADLPSSNNKVGDFYNVLADGKNYAWDGSAWDDAGGTIDTSSFWTMTAGQSNTLEPATVAEINAILNA